MKLKDFTEALENKYINISTSAKALNEDLSDIYNYEQINNQIKDSARKYNSNIESVDNFAYEEDYYGDMIHYFDIHINGVRIPCAVTDDEIDEYGMDKAIATAIWRDMANFDPDEDLNEDFWNPGKEFEEFTQLLNTEFDNSEWNNWNQAARDAFAEQVARRYLEINPTPTPMFFQDFTDNNFHTERIAFEKLLNTQEPMNESTKLTESSKRVAQISFDIMYDPESDEPNSQPEDIVYGFEWELDNVGDCTVLGSNIEDITDTYRQQYSKDFPELNESCRLNEDQLEFERCPNKVKDFISYHDQAWEDCCNYFNVDPHDENALDNIDIYDILDWVYDHDQLYHDLYSYVYPTDEEIERFFISNEIPDDERGRFSINDIIEESINESKMPPIRKILQDNNIMATLDKDPQATIEKALQLVRDSKEVSDEDKRTFENAVGKDSIQKRVSSLASYFYDVNRVGRRR